MPCLFFSVLVEVSIESIRLGSDTVLLTSVIYVINSQEAKSRKSVFLVHHLESIHKKCYLSPWQYLLLHPSE